MGASKPSKEKLDEGHASASTEMDLENCSLASNDVAATAPSARHKNTLLLVFMIVILGTGTAVAFLSMGITAARTARNDQENQFTRSSLDLVNKIEHVWEDYLTAAAWIHGRCSHRNFSRIDFREMYEYVVSSGLDFQAAQFIPNITNEERRGAEVEARAYYEENYPTIDYRGFVGFNFENSTTIEPRLNASFYFPIRKCGPFFEEGFSIVFLTQCCFFADYMEPVIGNEAAIDLDYHASGTRQRTVLFCTREGKPALTDRLRLVQETDEVSYGVVLMHPGIELSTELGVWPKDLASIVIRIPDLIKRSSENQQRSSAVFLFDHSDSSGVPLFFGGAKATPHGKNNGSMITVLAEVNLNEIRTTRRLYFEQNIKAANKVWTVSILSVDNTFKPHVLFVSICGTIIFLASLCLALWVYTHTKKVEQVNRMKAEADSEKAKLILKNAHEATRIERELNDFLSHEVRNPVSAAIAACSFVKAAVHDRDPLSSHEARSTVQHDVAIIENSLKFVNDLLRNMLDMHRAANKQLKVALEPTDLLHDVLEPVHSMINQRNATYKVDIECPRHLFVMTDRLRLKQIVLNLGRNSLKFVESGFVRLRAQVIDGLVEISVEDSGPGIPPVKRYTLFQKFQESLDMLCQGTVRISEGCLLGWMYYRLTLCFFTQGNGIVLV